MGKGQGAMEYLLLAGGGVLVTIVVLTLVLNLTGTGEGNLLSNRDSALSMLDQAKEKVLGDGSEEQQGPIIMFNENVENTPEGSDWKIEGIQCNFEILECEITISGNPPPTIELTIASEPITVTINTSTCTEVNETIEDESTGEAEGVAQSGDTKTLTCTVKLTSEQVQTLLAEEQHSFIFTGADGVQASASVKLVEQPPASSGTPILLVEFGKITANHNWTTVQLANQVFVNPIIIAKPISFTGTSPAHVRLRNVTPTSFDIKIEEWAYQDGIHSIETINYIAIEQGSYTIDGKEIIAGTVDSVDHDFKTVTFSAMPTTPIVLAQSQTYNGWDPIVTRLKGISNSGFQVKVQEEEAKGVHGVAETVGFIVAEEGTYTELFTVGITGTTDHNFKTFNFNSSNPTNTPFLFDMQSYAGGNTAGLRYTNLQNTGSIFSIDVKVEEEESADTETNHLFETIGYLIENSASSGLVAHYPFEGNANDTSGNENNGVVKGPTLTPDRGGQVYVFDGDDRIRVPDDDTLDFSDAFTIAGWFYFEKDIGITRLIAKEGIDGWSYRLITLDDGVFGHEDSLLMQINGNGSSGSITASTGFFESHGLLKDHKNKWVHIVSTYNGNSINLYINGTRVATTPVENIFISNKNAGLGIGATADGRFAFQGKIDEVRLYNIALTAEQIRELFSDSTSICGNGICEEGENITCPNDCLTCDGYAELLLNRTAGNVIGEPTALDLTLELYGLANTRSNLLEQKALKRKQVMLTLAEEDPAAFLEASIPNEDRKTIFSGVKQYIEKSETLEGRLEVFERPHLSEDGTNVVGNGGFDYFLIVGTQRFEIIFASSASNQTSGTEVIAKGFTLDSFIVISSGESKNFEITRQPDTSVNLGIQKIAIILTKGIGDQDPDIPFLETHMEETNNYYQEISYGQASLEWDVYGWYETEEGFPDSYLVADPDVDFSQYSRVISIDERNPFGFGSKGVSERDTDDGLVDFSFVGISPRVLQESNRWGTIGHELGHNFGAGHANRLECGDKTIDIRSNCISIDYGDQFDIMGGSGYKGHMNSFHKEIVGWIGNNEIVEVNSDGTYVLEAYEIFGDKMVLKIPRKIDEFGVPGSFYYLEYRTPIGYDSFITETQPNNGPQIRIFSNFPVGNSPLQLLDMTPESYFTDDGISLGQTFTDSITDTTISVVSLTQSAATIQVSIGSQQCIRRDPTLIITPTSIEGWEDERIDESFFYNFELINNDEIICSDREIYFIYNDPVKIINSKDRYSISEFNPLTIEGEDTAKGIIELNFFGVSYQGTYETTIEVIDIDRGLYGSENLIFTLSNQNFGPFNFLGKNPKRFYYNLDYFSFQADNSGVYIIDETGKIHRRGSTLFTADNIDDLSQLNTNGVVGLVYAPPVDDKSFEILDLFGNVYHTGDLSFLEKEKVREFPTFTCPIARDAIVWQSLYPKELLLLDAYGTVYLSESAITSRYACESWDGRTDYYRPGETHAVMLQPWDFSNDGYTKTTIGYYILSKDGTTYACGDADISYTQYNQPLPIDFGLGDRYAVSFALDQDNGIAMLDSHGNVYTSGTLTHHGEPAFGESIATDIQLLPETIHGSNAGYGVLATDGRLFECQFGTCDEWQNLHTG